MIFVFGSNLSGIHGAGAAAYAKKYYGAQWGVGEGRTGNAYALPTKGVNISFMPLSEVDTHIARFLEHASQNPDNRFKVTCVGCGLAGFNNDEIAPLFIGASRNCYFDLKWRPWLAEHQEFWGTI